MLGIVGGAKIGSSQLALATAIIMKRWENKMLPFDFTPEELLFFVALFLVTWVPFMVWCFGKGSGR
jgi:hypothetical protein